MNEITVPPEVVDAVDLAITELKTSSITTPEEYAICGERLMRAKKAKKVVAEFFRPIEEHAKALRKSIAEARDKLDLPLDQEISTYGKQIVDYEDAEAARRREKEAQLRRDLQRKADDEAAKRAADAAISGESAEDGFVPEPVLAPAPVVLPKEVPKVTGMYTQTRWDFEIVDASLIPRQYLIVDEVMIRKIVMAMKDAAEQQIPGIRVFQKKIVGGRS